MCQLMGNASKKLSSSEVLGILEEISSSEEEVKAYLRALNVELLLNDLSIEDVYVKVRDMQPNDPLEKHGLSMAEFDRLLSSHREDPAIQEAMEKRKQRASSGSGASDAITVEKLIEIHKYMITELEGLVTKQL